MAREEAARLHHEYVGTEHILLGLIREGEGVAAAVLQSLSVDLEEIQQNIEKTVNKGKGSQGTGPDLPYTSRAKKVLELAMSEARELNHSYVGTEHLLLGLLREEKGIAAQVLKDAGLDPSRSRAETLRLLGSPAPPDASWFRAGAGSTSRLDVGADQTSVDRLLSRCSPRLQDVIRLATTEARTLGQGEPHAEHLLIALLRQDDGLAALILRRLHTDVPGLRDDVSAEMEKIPRDGSTQSALAPSAVVALRLASEEAGRARATIGTDHLLLGLVRSDRGSASGLLRKAGLTADIVRRERAQIVG
jgi:ATP-dependent Clp protease ATP-binding subunit ClpA